MRKKRLLLLLLIAGLGVGGFAIFDHATAPEPEVSLASFVSLSQGTSRQQVEVTLGGPGERLWDSEQDGLAVTGYQWSADGVSIIILFSDDGSAVDGFYEGNSGLVRLRPPLSVLDRIKSLFGF